MENELSLRFDKLVFDTEKNEVRFEKDGEPVYTVKFGFKYSPGATVHLTGLNGVLKFQMR